MTGIGRMLLGALLAGWFADALARPDSDVEAGIEAYEAGDLEVALEHFDAALARHSDRPELSFNRGLVLLAQGEVDSARRAFESASEAEEPEVRASAFYERGNVAFDTEQWDDAIEAYTECLVARPDHANAKWNLELALQRKEQDDQDQEDEEDEQDEEDQGTGGEDSGGEESGDEGSSGGDTGGESSGGGDSGGEDSGGGDSGGEGSSGSPPPDEDTGGSGDEGGDSGEPPPGDSGDPPPDDGGTGGPPPPPPEPLDQMDIDKALEELDESDHFPLDRPVGGVRPPTKDW